MFLDKLDPQHDDTVLATAMLQANMRVGLAAVGGGVFGTIAGLTGLPMPSEARLVGIVVATTLGLTVGSGFVFLARNPPAGLVARFAGQIPTKRATPDRLAVVSSRGAMLLGALAFFAAFAVVSYSALAR